MLTRPTHRPPQTIKQAKAEYKKHGPRISSQELRQLKRGDELFRRAEKIKDGEKRRKAALKRKEQKELKEREARGRTGTLAHWPAVRRSQELLDTFMTGVRKPTEVQAVKILTEEEPLKPEEDEPWEDDIDDGTLMDLVMMSKEQPATPFIRSLRSIDKLNEATKDSPCMKTPTISDLDCAWENLLVSNTQIEREIKPEPLRTNYSHISNLDPVLSLLSTQDVTLSTDDLEELGLARACRGRGPETGHRNASKERDKLLMPPPRSRQKVSEPTNNVALSHRSSYSCFGDGPSDSCGFDHWDDYVMDCMERMAEGT